MERRIKSYGEDDMRSGRKIKGRQRNDSDVWRHPDTNPKSKNSPCIKLRPHSPFWGIRVELVATGRDRVSGFFRFIPFVTIRVSASNELLLLEHHRDSAFETRFRRALLT